MTVTDVPTAHVDAVIRGDRFRISVLTSRLIRLEWSENDMFTDAPTQLVVNRRFDLPDFTVDESDDALDVRTEHLHLHYDKQAFSPAGLSITMRTRAQSAHFTSWRYGDPVTPFNGFVGNLGGTARTLDEVDGAVDLEPGILSGEGMAVVDDSTSFLLTQDGWVEPRTARGEDLYFFGYGHDFQGALRDFLTLTGRSPLLPRWALGNWWSRYHAYTDVEYLDLMDRFDAAGVPFSVAVLDMDWHLVDIDPSLGSGWTGYTWNTELIPEPARLLRALHDRGLRVTLNLHPADGVRRHEAAYPEMARDLGMDPERGDEIAFDITSREFARSYFARLHHPQEEIGVDFWWVDWQSGSSSRVPGLDPLWMLNHLHSQDAGRDGKRPLVLSRYAGVGSHRYPVGFSGDAVTTWASLAFQPYFTATAANVGYFWWSHDIGGHMHGYRDDEMAARWVQFGAFSPINRLHSSSSPFNRKEPWHFGHDAELAMTDALRLRHRLVPYLYSAMWSSHTDGVAPVRPMYHDHPDDAAAYEVPNQYAFGPDLVVAPIVAPADRATRLGETAGWLPSGDWYDFLTGRRYAGGRRMVFHRPLRLMPVFARAGAIVPLAVDPGADVARLPDSFELRVFAGASGSARIIEDDGTSTAGAVHGIDLRLDWPEHPGEPAVLTVHADDGLDCPERAVRIRFVGVDSATVTVDGDPLATSTDERGLVVDLGTVDLRAGIAVRFTELVLAGPRIVEDVFTLLDEAYIDYDLKSTIAQLVDDLPPGRVVAALDALGLPGNLRAALVEVLTAG